MAYFSFKIAIAFFLITANLGFCTYLPSDHPIRPMVDVLFFSQITSSKEHLQKAGFQLITEDKYGDTVVARHPSLPGYLFKLFTDDQTGIDELERLMQRIHGADLAKSIIASHGWEEHFKVPEKWLYKLHKNKHILIVEDMDIYSKHHNLKKWASKKVNKEKLNVLYAFLTEGGFSDCIYPFNLPFSHDGRWAVIDTEKYHSWPIPFERLIIYLRYPMQIYWTDLTNCASP